MLLLIYKQVNSLVHVARAATINLLPLTAKAKILDH